MTLECEAAGTPAPQISWLKNGAPLLLSPRARLLSGDSVLRSAQATAARWNCVGDGGITELCFCEKGFPPRSCRTLGSTHVWLAARPVWPSSATMSRSKVRS